MTHAPISWRRRDATEADCDACDEPTPKGQLERCETCGAYVCRECLRGEKCAKCEEAPPTP